MIAIIPKGNLIVSNIEAASKAAIDGVGLATLGRWHTIETIKSGHLVEVLTSFQPQPLNVFLYYPSREHQAARTRVMIDYLTSEFNI